MRYDNQAHKRASAHHTSSPPHLLASAALLLLPPSRPCVSAISHQPSAISPQPSAPEATPCAARPVKTSQLASRIASHHPAASLHHRPCPPSGFDGLFARAVQPEPGLRQPPASSRSDIPISTAACRMGTPGGARPQCAAAVRRRRGGRDKTTAKGRPPGRQTTPHVLVWPARPGLI